MKLKKFLSSRGVWLALIVTILYGSLIFWIYSSGYQGVPKNLKNLPVTIVNQDQQSKSLAQQLKQKLPFHHVHQSSDLTQAQKDLNLRKTYLLINIPHNFSQNLRHNRQVKLHFYLNDANPSAIDNTLKITIQKLEQTINQNIIIKKQTLMLAQPALTKLQQSLQQQQIQSKQQIANAQQQINQAPTTQRPQLQQKLQQQVTLQQRQATAKARQEKQVIIQKSQHQAQQQVQSVTSQVHHQNKVAIGLNNSFAPFFANIALCLGAMIGALILYGVYTKFAPEIGRWLAFGYLELTFFILAVIGSILVSAIDLKIMPIGFGHYFQIMGGHVMAIFLYYNFNTTMLLLLGQIGTSINIILTMIQVVASAGMIPVLSMSKFFDWAHYLAPMYYGVQTDFNWMYGGTLTSQQQLNYLLLAGGILCLNAVIVTIRKKQPMLQFEYLS